MNLLMIDLFQVALLTNQLNAKKIARIIKDAIVKDILPGGTLLPQCSELAKHLKVSRKMISVAYQYLENRYHLVKDSASCGAVVVDTSFTDSINAMFHGHATPNASHPREILLNVVTIKASSAEAIHLNQQLRKSTERFETDNPELRNIAINYGLVNTLRGKINGTFCGTYGRNELVYTSNFKQLIHTLCFVLVSRGETVVLPASSRQEVANAVGSAGKKFEWIEDDKEGRWLAHLESLCQQKKVGIFYMSSRASFPFNYQFTIPVLEKILLLQQQYKFTIIEDDRYANCEEDSLNPLMNLVYGKKLDVIYLRALSLSITALEEIYIAAGPARIISDLTEILVHSGKLLPAPLAAGLCSIMEAGILRKYDNRVNKGMEETRLVASDILASSCLWKENGLSLNARGFFHLEPLEGFLPDDMYQLLVKEGIYVFNPGDYARSLNQINGVTINVAAYFKDESRLEKDLGRLMEILESKITYVNN